MKKILKGGVFLLTWNYKSYFSYEHLRPYFHLELALKTWAKASLSQSLEVHEFDTLVHSFASFQWWRFCNQWTLLLTENCQKWSPYKVVFMPVSLARWVVFQPVLTKGILHPAKAAAMCLACLKCACPSPSSTFFASAKHILKMDCATW